MKVPEDMRSEINRLAHALSQWSFVEIRRKLLAEAAALLKSGASREQVLRRLAETAPQTVDQYAQTHPHA